MCAHILNNLHLLQFEMEANHHYCLRHTDQIQMILMPEKHAPVNGFLNRWVIR